MAAHQQDTDQEIIFNRASIVSKAPHFVNCKICEPKELSKHQNNIIRDTVHHLHVIWHKVVQSNSITVLPT